jgi:hypothetical protein
VEAELAREEAAKEQLCSELNTLVQQSANAQLVGLRAVGPARHMCPARDEFPDLDGSFGNAGVQLLGLA